MFLLSWYNEFLSIRRENERLKIELRKESICESCEYLKMQIAREQELNRELMEKLTDKPEPMVIAEPKVQVPIPKFIPWKVRKQMLEAEDRRTAQVLKDKQNEMQQALRQTENPNIQGPVVAPDDDPDVIALEQEMDLISKEREAKDLSAPSGGVKFNAS